MSQKLSEIKISADIFPMVLLVLGLWLALQVGLGWVIRGGETVQLAEGTQGSFKTLTLLAALFALGCVGFWRIWKETGFTRPAADAKWWVLIIPMIMILVVGLRAFGQDPKPMNVILMALVNVIFVGISEEVMFRGLMFSGLSKRFSYWPAVLLTTALFGAIHLFNIVSTGEVGQSILQSLLAMLSGALYLAVRLSMGSIIPAILIHILWDWVGVLAPAGPATPEEFSNWDLLGLVAVAKPLVFGILGFWVLWRIKKYITADASSA